MASSNVLPQTMIPKTAGKKGRKGTNGRAVPAGQGVAPGKIGGPADAGVRGSGKARGGVAATSAASSGWWERAASLSLRYGLVVQVVLVAAAVLLVYGWTLDVPFYLDDFSNIEENPSIYQWDGTLKSLWKFGGLRTMAFLTLGINYKLHAFQVAGYHIVNIAIHLITSLLVLALVRSLSRTPALKDRLDERQVFWASLFAGLLFAVHPLHIQAVTYIVQRMASLAALFYVASVVGFVRARCAEGMKARMFWAVLCVLMAGFAFITKQNTATLPIAIVLVEIVFFGRSKRKLMWMGIGGVAAVFGIWVIFSFILHFNPFSLEVMEKMTQETSAISRISYFATQTRVLWLYLKLFVWPANLLMDYQSYPISRDFWEGIVPFALAGHLMLIGLGISMIRRKPMLAFGIIFYYVAHAVESSFIPITDVVFEHRAYLPDVGLCCLVGFSAGAWCPKEGSFIRPTWVRVAAFTLLVALGIAGWQRNEVWRDPVVLWQDNANKLPSNRRAWEILGKYLVEKGRFEESLEASNKSAIVWKDAEGITQHTYSHEALLNLIVANIHLKRYDQARRLIEEGLKTKMTPLNRSKLLTNYGNIFYREGKLFEAEQVYLQAIEAYPAGLPPRINLGAIYAATNRFQDAERIMAEALAIDPNNSILLNNRRQLRDIQEHQKNLGP